MPRKNLRSPSAFNVQRSAFSSRRICFVTGTRAEFGLMESTLRAIHQRCHLQIIATGMHLSRAHGHSLRTIRAAGWKINATIPWKDSNNAIAVSEATGIAIAHLSRAFSKLKPDIVLVVGDRVEAFAAAAAAHISGIPLAHIHGGDRALGQVDDSLRHAITKLAHIHFPATQKSAQRIRKLGEDHWRIRRVGSPGIDGIVQIARQSPTFFPSPDAPGKGGGGSISAFSVQRSAFLFALILLHPIDPDSHKEFSRAQTIYRIASRIFPKLVVIYPNNDPGSAGILRCWKSHARDPHTTFFPNIPRPEFLALLRDAAMLIGNSSSGIIEAASFGTPVLDIGPRQQGREHGPNVLHAEYSPAAIRNAIQKRWNNGHPKRFPRSNIYGHGHTAEKIAAALLSIPLNHRLRQKLIAY